MAGIFCESSTFSLCCAAGVFRGFDLGFGDLLTRRRARIPMQFAFVGWVDVNAGFGF